MMMLLTLLCMSFLTFAVSAVCLRKELSENDARPEIKSGRPIALDPPRFFAGDLAAPPEATRIPIAVLKSEIERHVRVEQAAAESYLDVPTREKLHTRYVN